MKYIKLFENFLDEYLIEDRRYIHDDLETQIINFVQKYKGKEDKIFVSFRSSEHVTMINRKNTFGTPTGIYTYPWKGYFDKRYEERIKGKKVININLLVPFAGKEPAKYIYLYKIKDDAKIISNITKYEELREFAEKIEPFYPNNIFLSKYLKSEDDYLNYSKNPYSKGIKCPICDMGEVVCYDCKGEGYFEDGEQCYNCYGTGKDECYPCHGTGYESEIFEYVPAHIFWVLLYDIVGTTGGNLQLKFTNLCNKIGVDGFVDYGSGYIHPNEKIQAVLLKGRSIIEDYAIVSTDSGMDIISISSKILEMDKDEFKELLDLKIYDRKTAKYKDDVVNNLIRNLRKENKLEALLIKLTKELINDRSISFFTENIKKFLTESELNFLQELENKN
jgi:hypothetical protein